MSYEYITKFDSPNFTKGRQGNKITEIIIHHWGNDGQSFNGVVNWLCRANGNSSAHYVVESNKVACIINCSDTAWHAGNFPHNLKSIGIECRPEMSAGDLETVCELVADLYKTYGVLPILGHKDVSATSCPGRYYSKLGYIKQRAIEIMNGKKPQAQKPQPTPKPTPSKHKYKIGEHVVFSTCYRSSADPNNLAIGAGNMARNHGVITKIVNAKNPYLLDNGLCWVNDGDIRGFYNAQPNKSIDDVAREVIRGDWGNGQDRVNRLRAAGYDPNAVQNKVNQLM